MAYRVEKKTLADLNSGRKAVGIKYPFNGAFTSTYSTLDTYKSNLMLYFMTSKGERFLNPEFGNTLNGFLFEPELSNDDIENLKSTITTEISMFFPRLVLDSLEIKFTGREYALRVQLKYHIVDTPLSDELILDYE